MIPGQKAEQKSTNATIDLVKLIMSILVVGIHSEPFGFNLWLDRGFGIVTRLCVPFFFVTSGYYFWIKPKSAAVYIKRVLMLYCIWSLLYLPYDIAELKTMSLQEILVKYLWVGNDHALWYLCGSIFGFLVVFGLLKLMNEKKVFIISVFFLLVGCFKSTWAPLFNSVLQVNICDYLGSRNGLFYAFPYIALGMAIAKNAFHVKEKRVSRYIWGLSISIILLVAESLLFVIYYHTDSTILWISVLPCTYYFFMLVKNHTYCPAPKIALYMRKMSTLIYVEHSLFLILFKGLVAYELFFATAFCSALLAFGIVKLSEIKHFGFIKYLY